MEVKKAKIAFLIPRFGIVDRGGEVTTYEMARRLAKEFKVTIFARRRVGADATLSSLDKEFRNMRVIKLLSLTSHNGLASSLYRFDPRISGILDMYFLSPENLESLSFSFLALFYLLFGKFDLIFPQNGFWGALVARMIRAVKGTPFIMRSNGGIESMVAKQSPDCLICETPTVYRWYKKHRKNTNLKLISPGTDLKKFSPDIKAANISLEKPIFLAVAALISSKRIDLAVKAVAKLGEGSLLIIGDGPLEKDIRILGNKILGKTRFKIKKARYEDMPRYYSACNVFTLPSLDEPFGIVYLEAMASGLPVVAPDDESRRYIIGKAGEFCDVANIDEYSKALKLAASTNFNGLPRKQAQKFSWEKISKEYKKLIEEFI